jgi:hypothetical protein
MLDTRLAVFMQRVVSEEKVSVTVGKSSLQLHDEYALGRRLGKTVCFSPREREEMARMLKANGYALSPVDTSGMSRSDKLAAGVPNEKSGVGTVKVGRVSIKSLAGQALQVGGKTLALPHGCHLDANWHEIVDAIGHSSIMVVENYEVFDQIHRVNLSLLPEHATPLVIYRGDPNESRQDNVLALLNALNLPVLAFVDIDPQGLHIAASLPRLAGLLAPRKAFLEEILASPKTGRCDLFQAQYPVVGDSLEALTGSRGLRSLWQLLKTHRAGVVQERWIGLREACIVW